jgi:group I intron endonuclease
MIIYEIRNKITNGCYIGQTTRALNERWFEHKYSLRSNTHGNRYLQFAWNKYGEANFSVKIIAHCTSLEDLNAREVELIKSGQGTYNLAKGGNSFIHSDEAKTAIIESQRKPVIGMNIKTGETRRYSSVSDVEKDGIHCRSVGGACALMTYNTSRGPMRRLSVKGWVWMYENDYTPEEMEKRRSLASSGKTHQECPVACIEIATNKIFTFVSMQAAKRAGYRVTSEMLDNTRVVKGRLWMRIRSDNYEHSIKERLKAIQNESIRRIR